MREGATLCNFCADKEDVLEEGMMLYISNGMTIGSDVEGHICRNCFEKLKLTRRQILEKYHQTQLGLIDGSIKG